ncbi:hypothetical protein GCM10010433_59760 [Streptomyces pulveraceus]
MYVEELGSGLRFVARQYGHVSMLPYAVGGPQAGSSMAEGGVRRVGPYWRGRCCPGVFRVVL